MSAQDNDTRLWHPFADMGAVRHAELVIERGEGVWVYDADGRRYLDATASLWYANIGHGRAEIADAVARADARSSRPTRRSATSATARPTSCAERLAARAPMADARVFLASGGGDAIDTAAKIARRHWVQQGQPERVAPDQPHAAATTARTASAPSIGGIEANTSRTGARWSRTSRASRTTRCPRWRRRSTRVGPERVAAFFCEPVIGAGGVYPPPEGYIEGVADLCAEHGILFVIDS